MPRSKRTKKNGSLNVIGGASHSASSPPFQDSLPSILLDGGQSLIVKRAIASASRHGIELDPGRSNQASGNCAFKAPIFNLNDRPCFMENLSMSIDYYRRLWITDAENLLFDGPFNPGYSYSEWHAGFERLKESNIYEVDFFGDMVIPAIACGLRKELLIFNTNINLPRTPVTLISPSEFGVEPNSKIPIVLAYDLSHYESLHPIDNDAIQKSIALASLIKEGNYHFSHQDLGQLVNLSLPLQQQMCLDSSEHEEEKTTLKVNNISETEAMRDITKSQKRKNVENIKTEADTFKSPTVNKKVRDMNEAERRSYRREQYNRRQNGLTKEEIGKQRQDWSSRKYETRVKKRDENEELFKHSRCTEKSTERAQKREEDGEAFKESRHFEKSTERAKKREKDGEAFKESRRSEKSKEREKKKNENEPKYRKKMAEEQAKTRTLRTSTDEKRGKCFRDSIKYGRIYECVCCQRLFFTNGVKPFTDSFKSDLGKSLVDRAIGKNFTGKLPGEFFVCITCKSHLSRGKMPPMSNQNNLQLLDLSKFEELNLTELENAMIALNIIFQKVFKLPKSRWPAMKDKTINVPIHQSDVLNTIESLPRTPSEAGIIPINFKRKAEYKNSHMVQYISVPKILKALKTIKELGNPYYQFVTFNENFEDDCKENDLEGFQFIFPEDEIADNDIQEEVSENIEEFVKNSKAAACEVEQFEQEKMVKNVYNESENVDNIEKENDILDEIIDEIDNEKLTNRNIIDELDPRITSGDEPIDEINQNQYEDEETEFERLEKEEEEYRRYDPVKKWQFEYNRSTCFSDNYPEISYREDNGDRI